MANRLDWPCHACGNVGFEDGSDGFFYCTRCGSQAEGIIDTDVADEDMLDRGDGHGALYSANHRRQIKTPQPISLSEVQSQTQSQFWDSLNALDDDIAKTQESNEPTGPTDFGLGPRTLSYEDYYSEVRMRYVMGIQIMIQLQCKALVEKFKVNSMICGLAGTIWLRLVALTRVFDDNWADEKFHDSESQKEEQPGDSKPQAKYRAEPHNLYGQRAVMIWHKSLSKTIPLSCSLVISYLACHIAREAVLPTDILKWSLEGKLPYFAAFVEIEKQIGPPSRACPLSSSLMFRPTHPVPSQKLESLAASIAQKIGLELPPVNFYPIASRYLRQLSIPIGKIIPHACRIYEWSMPSELWLSANEFRLPSRVYVMSILIVAIRILYNINGFGKWEMSLSSSTNHSSPAHEKEKLETMCDSDATDDAKQDSSDDLEDSGPDASINELHVENSELDAAELLLNLEARYDELGDAYDFSKDLPSYLQYCKDVVFAGLEPSFEDHEEAKLIDEFWDFYQNQKDFESSDEQRMGSSGLQNKRSRIDIRSTGKENKKMREEGSASISSTDGVSYYDDECLQQTMNHDNSSMGDEDSVPGGQAFSESQKSRAIRKLKSNMEENRFCYIPPRVNVKRYDYLHYVRKRDKGAFTYAAHADYYILLRSCAKVVQVDIRSMHTGVLSFERRLAWLEKRIDHCLHLNPPNRSCEFCSDEMQQNAADDSIGFSELNL
ncbi:TATA box-binding protein-associated factor RNA polymerase I subunit B [Cornus florida]|uniref:TATA box-binding protein-associated factor RNA polymerase I subunit B n=1 Tax=Cornus florida TaxID=4283 RepID=UPI0028A1E997|nr:TATA box-binding protein-associated factor RNA polymerase I subunit B [Cornus florida]